LDGLAALLRSHTVNNFWDSGVLKDTPDFGDPCPYDKDDWDVYREIAEEKWEGITVVRPLAGSRFKYANQNDDGTSGADGLYIAAPTKSLIEAANKCQDFNDASYVISYRSQGGVILLPGDAHDLTWENIINNNRKDIEDCSILIAPHHGRGSDRDFAFLDTARPKLTLFGCAPSEHLAYDAWYRRKLPIVTSNQAGNIVIESTAAGIQVFVENETYASACGADTSVRNEMNYVLLYTIAPPTKQ
jgi:hypothetical protein